MEKDLNKVELIGTVNSDPRSGTSGTGTSYLSFEVAIDESYIDAAKGSKVERVSRIKMVAFNKLAETTHLTKGARVHVIAKVTMMKDKETSEIVGKDRYAMSLIATEITLLKGSKEEGKIDVSDLPF